MSRPLQIEVIGREGGMKVPRIQILTAAQILDNSRRKVPFGFTEGFKKAAREEAEQDRLF